jgi:hypothetical protein
VYFPKQQHDRQAGLICRLICMVILKRAEHEIKPIGRHNAGRLNRVLSECGIKKTEFAEVVASHPGLTDLLLKFQGTLQKKQRRAKKNAPGERISPGASP